MALEVGASSNHNQVTKVGRLLGADVLHPALPIGTEKVESKAVLLLIQDTEETTFQEFPPGRIHIALENRILDTKAIILAGFRNFPQPLLACSS
jgi:hypothetical protein